MANTRTEYEGRAIELRERKGKPSELVIDGKALRYRQLPDGRYFLEEYAYDWTDDLMDLARRYIDHEERKRRADTGKDTTRGRK